MSLPAIIGILCQATEVVETTNLTNGNQSFLQLIMESNPIIKVTLLILVAFSVISWAIIGSKYRQLRKDKKRSNRFYKLFWQAKSIDAVVSKGSFRKSPAFNVFKSGVDSLRENHGKNGASRVAKEIQRTAEDEIEQMEYGVPFLATTGSSAPFIGLFGTVFGVLMAFWKIGRTGSSSIAIIGPNIAEALITTAVGLVAAIPAIIFYNIYVTKIRILSKDLSNFSDDLSSRIEKEYFEAN